MALIISDDNTEIHTIHRREMSGPNATEWGKGLHFEFKAHKALYTLKSFCQSFYGKDIAT